MRPSVCLRMQGPVVLLIILAAGCLMVTQAQQTLDDIFKRALDTLAANPVAYFSSTGKRVARATAEKKGRSGTAALRWRSCGNRKDPMQLQRFEIKPNPLKVPGPLRADLALLVREPVAPPIKVAVRVHKEIELPLGLGSTWVELPCPGNSCSVPDACANALLPKEGSLCPAPTPVDNSTLGQQQEEWRPCICPIPKGLYVMPPLQFNLTRPARGLIPEFLLNGGFQVQLRLSRHKRRLACVQTTLDLDL